MRGEETPRRTAAGQAMVELQANGATATATSVVGLSPLSETLWRDNKSLPGAGAALIGEVSARLTWKDLSVTVALGPGKTQTVLDELTGFAEPGSLTALMGPSGSGKSTLLDALAGRLAANAFLSGSVLLNGRKAKLSFGAAVRLAYLPTSSVVDLIFLVYPTTKSPFLGIRLLLSSIYIRVHPISQVGQELFMPFWKLAFHMFGALSCHA